MHRHSAWAILGVDPTTQRCAEELAAREGMSVGGLLQQLLAEHASSKSARQDGIALRQRLVPLFQEIVDSIGQAAKVLAEVPPADSADRAADLAADMAADSAADLAAAPPRLRQADAPSFEEIQDWLRRVDANKTSGAEHSKAAESGRSVLRRAG